MDTNVGDMPLDIFCDYVSDILGEEWSWEYLQFAINGFGNNHFIFEIFIGNGIDSEDNGGDGYLYNNDSNAQWYGCGIGYEGGGILSNKGQGDGTGIGTGRGIIWNDKNI